MSKTTEERCAHRVRERGSSFPRYGQCKRKAVKDGLCKQHHPDAFAERARKADEMYQRRREQSAPYLLKKQMEKNKAMRAMVDRIKVRAYELGQQELHDMALEALQE